MKPRLLPTTRRRITKPKAPAKASRNFARLIVTMRNKQRIAPALAVRGIGLTVVVLASLFSFSLTAAAPAAPTLAQVLAKAYTARGGLVRLRAMQGQRVTGTISFGNDAPGPFFVEMKRPLKMHLELTVQNQTMVRIFDGKEGWANNPFTGKASL